MNDPLVLLKQDHQAVKKLLKSLRETEEGPTRRSQLEDLERSIALHVMLENEVTNAMVGSALGASVADQAHREHELLTRSLSELHDLSESPDFCVAVAMVRGGFKQHVKAVEREVLPQLKASIGADGWRSLGDHIAVVKADALIRPGALVPLKTMKRVNATVAKRTIKARSRKSA